MKFHNEYTVAFMFFYGIICLCRGEAGTAAYWLLLAAVVWAFNVRFEDGKLRADRLNLPARIAAFRRWQA